MKKLPDNFILGIIIALLLPAIAFSIFATISFPYRSIEDTLLFYRRGSVITHVISLSVISNLVVFFIFLNSKKEKTARGIIGGSFVYVFIVLILILIK